ncbi:MAG: hypothetical protein RLZ25_1149 [Pseudomonadota bacterium]|jgi:hypothetical protein
MNKGGILSHTECGICPNSLGQIPEMDGSVRNIQILHHQVVIHDIAAPYVLFVRG